MAVKEKTVDYRMMDEALKAVAIIPRLNPQERGPYLSALMLISYKLLRTAEGDEFVLGWLQAALQDVQTQAPDVAINELH